MPLSTQIHKTSSYHEKVQWQHHFLCCNTSDGYTSSQADNSPQALPPPHDDGGQNLASQKAVLDTCGQGVETLVTQHRYLVMQSAATHWKLERDVYKTGQAKQKENNLIFGDIQNVFDCAIQWWFSEK